MKIGVNPADPFTLFAGGGYNLVGFGTNFGAQYVFPSKKESRIFSDRNVRLQYGGSLR